MPIRAHFDDATYAIFRQAAKDRRNRLLAERNCINGEHHEKPEQGVRCPWCVWVHRYGLTAVLEAEGLADPLVPRRPTGYAPRPRAAAVVVAHEAM